MNLRYFIVDDDAASTRMLEQIIEESGLGEVVGTSDNGTEAAPLILFSRPDMVLIDLLMPDLDGIETMDLLRRQGFEGQFIMISQITNKEMVGEAYEKGVEFFIHKPINRKEVQSILGKTAEQIRLRRSVLAIKQSLAGIEPMKLSAPKPGVRETALSILQDMGIAGEAGCGDILLIMEILLEQKSEEAGFPPLKDLYEAVARRIKKEQADIKKESKAIEQRIRRAILTALNNLASLGSMDYANPIFEFYAPRYFDFHDVRLRMRELEVEEESTKAKLNIKKFLYVLYLETKEKMSQY